VLLAGSCSFVLHRWVGVEQLLIFFPGRRPMSILCGVDMKIIQLKQVAIDTYYWAVFSKGHDGIQAERFI
jgi:hypothetical protein